MSEFIVETHQLTKSYADKKVLDNLTLQLEPGLVHGIVGNNGAGKSTLLKILLGLSSADSGSSQIMHCDSQTIKPALRTAIGYINADYQLPEHLNISQLAQLQKAHFVDWDQALFEQIIASIDVNQKHHVGQLSRGQKTSVNLALTMAQKPKLLILDEPTAGLDMSSQQFVFDMLLTNDYFEKHTILYCTHRSEELERIADNVVVLNNGKLVAQGDVNHIINQVSHWRVCFDSPFKQLSTVPGLLSSRLMDDVYYFSVNSFAGDLTDFFNQNTAAEVQQIQPNFAKAVAALTNTTTTRVKLAGEV
ncbi:MAG: ABC transporter ATP-binding protein [Algicola sp.]|nr:ABC transporter ATP-binding protein [Algicola sp.]